MGVHWLSLVLLSPFQIVLSIDQIRLDAFSKQRLPFALHSPVSL
jgi:hypothetical protein